MNWGRKIALAYTGFLVLIITLVIFTMKEDVHLVTKDYYREELNYQDKINKMQRAGSLSEPLTIKQEEGLLTVRFPRSIQAKDISGEINFFRPSDPAMDRKFSIQSDSLGSQSISTTDLINGLWKVQIDWKVDTTEFYNEETIVVMNH